MRSLFLAVALSSSAVLASDFEDARQVADFQIWEDGSVHVKLINPDGSNPDLCSTAANKKYARFSITVGTETYRAWLATISAGKLSGKNVLIAANSDSTGSGFCKVVKVGLF